MQNKYEYPIYTKLFIAWYLIDNNHFAEEHDNPSTYDEDSIISFGYHPGLKQFRVGCEYIDIFNLKWLKVEVFERLVIEEEDIPGTTIEDKIEYIKQEISQDLSSMNVLVKDYTLTDNNKNFQ